MRLKLGFLMVVIFLFGALWSAFVGLWHPYVTVKIKNVSQQPLSDIEVKFQNTEGKGAFNLYLDGSLKPGEEKNFHFYVESEGAFSIKATFADDRFVEGIGGYVELKDTRLVEVDSQTVKLVGKR